MRNDLRSASLMSAGAGRRFGWILRLGRARSKRSISWRGRRGWRGRPIWVAAGRPRWARAESGGAAVGVRSSFGRCPHIRIDVWGTRFSHVHPSSISKTF